MTGMADGTTGTTVGATAEDDDELLNDGRAPPSPAPLRREVIDAVDDARADERTEPKPGVHDGSERNVGHLKFYLLSDSYIGRSNFLKKLLQLEHFVARVNSRIIQNMTQISLHALCRESVEDAESRVS